VRTLLSSFRISASTLAFLPLAPTRAPLGRGVFFRVLQIDYYACLYCGLPAVLVKAVFDRHAIPPSAARAGRRRAPSPACGWSRAWSRSGSAPSPSTGWVMLTAENDYGSLRTTSCCTASWGCRAGYAGGAAGLARVACATNKESLRLV
jgi:hypothetical protein